MPDATLDALRDVLQEDVGRRGLQADPAANLIDACADDFAAACRDLAGAADPTVAVVTGFFIPHANPPAAETDGPLGALFLARAFAPLGIPVVLATDEFCIPALRAGLAACRLQDTVRLVTLPSVAATAGWSAEQYGQHFAEHAGQVSHLIALERGGPGHTAATVAMQPGADETTIAQFLREVPVKLWGRCRNMRGDDVSTHLSPVHLLFEAPLQPPLRTIGIGDGGNEIGMGKVPWAVIQRNIPHGGLIACRVPTDHLIVCGVSNWGAYGLAAGVYYLRGVQPPPALFLPEREQELLAVMVKQGPLVDGVRGRPEVSVDGLDFDDYIEPMRRLGALVNGREGS
jgi:D-glutamate cyclase